MGEYCGECGKPLPHTHNPCSQCGNDITVMCFLSTGVCSENCRKTRDNDHVLAGSKRS